MPKTDSLGRKFADEHYATYLDELEAVRAWYGHGETIARTEMPQAAGYIANVLRGEDIQSTVLLPRPSLVAIHKAIQTLRGNQNPSAKAINAINSLLTIAGANSGNELAVKGHLAPEKVQTCVETIPTFYDTLQQIHTGEFRDQLKVTVYYQERDNHVVPVLMRKSSKVPTALALQPLELNGMRFPAGTVVSIPDSEEHTATHSERVIEHGKATYAITPVPNDISLGYGGLSPWAFPNHALRIGFAVTDMSQGEADVERLEMAVGVELDDFRQAAQTVLSMCGVASERIAP